MGVQITARHENIVISGQRQPVRITAEIIHKMQKRLLQRGRLEERDVRDILTQTEKEMPLESSDTDKTVTVFSHKGLIEPFTPGQKHYIETMQANDLTICTGPAGTGKTYLAVAVAVSMLKKKQVRKLVLARPAVEAGEKLGFLPGDLHAKVNPYLRPLFDSLEDMMEFGQMRKFMEMDIIEVVPLAFMRGRTLNEAAILCDEAQNTVPSQMLMFLTRMGRGSKMIITGDITQVDLEPGQTSGLIDARRKLQNIPGIGFVELGEKDIVRHRLVQDIVFAYDRNRSSKSPHA
ncbi:MAG: PhoH family protein [Phycisphaerae bacterium]|nr:PhoH family protein [Phycisphaerae bacterium]